MTCQEAGQLLDAYFDGELDLVHTLEVEQHLKDCAGCQAIQHRNQMLRRSLQSPGLYLKAPDTLKDLVRPSKPPVLSRRSPVSWLFAAAAAILLCLVGFGLFYVIGRQSSDQILASDVVASHIRSLMPGHLTDVASTDHHTVKPWFAGKLDFSPTVKDLRPQGYPLLGGRLDYLDGRVVAALLYSHAKHTINLFIWPVRKSNSEPRALAINGYNLVQWNQNGMTYWAVSDLNAQELAQFAREQLQP